MLWILNALHVGFITFPLKLDHLVNNIKKVNWNTAVKTPYLTIRPKFDRKKSLYEMFFYIDTYKGLLYLDELSWYSAMHERQHFKWKCHNWHNLWILLCVFCNTISQNLERSIKPKLDEKIEKIVSKQENRSLNNVSLVISVCNIVLRFFSPWFSDVHCKNMTVEHADPVLVYAHT